MIKKLFIAALLAAPLCLSAQNKIGSVNSQEILPLMPEVKQAQTTLEAVSKQYDEEFQNLQNEFNKNSKSTKLWHKTLRNPSDNVANKTFKNWTPKSAISKKLPDATCPTNNNN